MNAYFLYGSSAALAGAWNEPAGDGVAIFAITGSGGSRTFGGDGRLAPDARFHRVDGSAYVEYGVTDWLMAVVQPDLTSVSLDRGAGASYRGLGASSAGAQMRLLLYGPAVFAVSATFRVPGSTDRRDPALAGQTSHDADLRALFGTSFALGGWPAFLDAEAAYRVRDARAPDEIHGDITLGVRPWPALMLLLQAFNTTGIGRGTSWFPRQDFTHVELAAVYDLDQDWSFEIGAFTTVLGRHSLREQGVTTAVWRRF